MTQHPTAGPGSFKTFLVLWASQSLSMVGSELTYFALNIWLAQRMYPGAHQKPELALALSALGLAYAVPSLALAPVAGSWVDRHDRRKTMAAMDWFSCALAVLMLVLLLQGRLSLWLLVAIQALMSAASAFHSAAFDTSYATLVEPRLLPRANGMVHSINAIGNVAGPPLAALLITLPGLARAHLEPGWTRGLFEGLEDGTALAIGADAASFFIGGVTLLFLKIPSPRVAADTAEVPALRRLKEDLQLSLRFIRSRPMMQWLLATFTMANLFHGAILVLQPLLLKFHLAEDWRRHGFQFEGALAFLASAGSLGALVGAFGVSAWGGLHSRRFLGVMVPMAIAGLALMLLGLSPFLYLCAAAAFLASAMAPVFDSHSQTLWQSVTPSHLQGRVFSVRRVIAQCTGPLGIALAGAGAGLFDLRYMIVLVGLTQAVVCLAQAFNPAFTRAEAQGLRASEEP
jgi:DHA3 family macrolide efflux protein-like MFS transporter